MNAILQDVKYWWLALTLIEQLFLFVTILIEVYLIFVKKTPFATILAAILFFATMAYFTGFFGISPSDTRGTLNLNWKASGNNIVPNAGW